MTTEPHNIIVEDFSAYIIKYTSENFPDGIYLIWFTGDDEDATDQFLTLKNGKIFGTKYLENLYQNLLDKKCDTKNKEQFISWIDREFLTNSHEIIEDSSYNTSSLISELKEGNFSVQIIENYAKFINIFGDFARQDSKNLYLLQYENNESIKELWTYYYEAIFWPRFNDKKLFESTELPNLDIDKTDLISKLKEIIVEFDKNIENKTFC